MGILRASKTTLSVAKHRDSVNVVRTVVRHPRSRAVRKKGKSMISVHHAGVGLPVSNKAGKSGPRLMVRRALKPMSHSSDRYGHVTVVNPAHAAAAGAAGAWATRGTRSQNKHPARGY